MNLGQSPNSSFQVLPSEYIRYVTVKFTHGSQASWLKYNWNYNIWTGYQPGFPLKPLSSSLTPRGPLKWIILMRITNTGRSLAKIKCFIFYGLVIISGLSSKLGKSWVYSLISWLKVMWVKQAFKAKFLWARFGVRSDTLVYVGGADCTLWRRLKWAAITLLPLAIKQTRVLELVIVATNRKTCGYDEILMKIRLFNFKIYWLI